MAISHAVLQILFMERVLTHLKFVVSRRPVHPNRFAQGGYRLMPRVFFVSLQRFQAFELTDAHGIIVVVPGADGDLAA